jgi:hypothetical protein
MVSERGLGCRSVAGEGKGKEKKNRKIKGEELGLGFTRVSSAPPPAADPRVVDLRVARVEPDHRSSAGGRARDLIGDEASVSATRRLSGRAAAKRSAAEALDGGALTQR